MNFLIVNLTRERSTQCISPCPPVGRSDGFSFAVKKWDRSQDRNCALLYCLQASWEKGKEHPIN